MVLGAEGRAARAGEGMAWGARFARFVSLTAFLTTLLIYSPNMMALHGSDKAELTSHFAEPLLLVTFVAALIFALTPGLRRLVALRPVGAGALALYAVGELVFAALLLGQPVWGAPVATVASVAVAVTLVPACAAWAGCLCELDLRRCLGALALGFAISALCNMVLTAVGAPWSLLAFMVLVLVGVAWPAARLLARGCGDVAAGGSRVCGEGADADHAAGALGAANRADSPGGAVRPDGDASVPAAPNDLHGGLPGDVGLSESAARPWRAHARAFLSVMGVPLLGMVISSFAMGVQPAFLFGDAVDAQHLGMLVADALLLALALAWARSGRRPLFSLLYQVVLPACAAASLVLCALPAPLDELGLAATYVFYSLVSCVGVAAAVATANAGEFSRSGMVAALVAAFCGSGILGIFLGARVADLIDNNAAVLVILTTAYGCWLLLSGCLKSWRLMVGTAEDGNAATPRTLESARPASDPLDERIARLAQDAGLSPRETEVLGFVGRGHSSVYVAKTLLVSESTVYTHVRNLYRKLGVSSREALIQLLNEPAGEGPTAR